METKEKVNDLLNQLIQINNDRIDGYEKAAQETDDYELKSLFTSMASKSRILNNELGLEVSRRNGKPTGSTATLGKAFRAYMDYMDFKAALHKDRKTILSCSELGEDAALDTYEDVLNSEESLPTNLVLLIRRQKEKLQNDHDRVQALRDSVYAVY